MADYLLDTNILILHLRGRLDIAALLDQWGRDSGLCISVISRMEILAGMHPHEEGATMALLDSLVNLPLDEAVADRAGTLMYRYSRQGTPLSFPDALIAATAMHHGLILATTDPKHFPMPDLRLHRVWV